MKKLTNALKLCAVLAAASACAWTHAQTQTDFQRHMEASTLNTGGDPSLTNSWRAFYCNLPDNNNQIVLDQRAKNTIRVPLTKLFDDVWYIGSEYVGQYIIKNASGFVVIDSGNNSQEAQTYTVPALQSLGLSARLPLNAVLLTHGHADHDGGAAYLKTTLGATVYLGSADAAGKTYAPTTWDSSNLNPYYTTVAGQSITVLATPGHTNGATAYIIQAHDNGKPVKLFVSGGSSMQSTVPTIVSYLDSMERTYAMVKAQKVDSASNPHVYWDGSIALVKKIEAEGLKSPSQFIIGNEKLLRALAIGRECTAAWLAKSDPTSVVPVWRVSALEFLSASPSPKRIAARLSNAWGPIPYQQISFKNENSGATCVATSDANGTATCDAGFGDLRPGIDKIVASFAGATSPGVIDLGSESSAVVDLGCRDLVAAKAAVGSRRGDARYVPRLDVDGNNVIDIRDISAIARLVPSGTVCQA